MVLSMLDLRVLLCRTMHSVLEEGHAHCYVGDRYAKNRIKKPAASCEHT
jgi:hypothetical protein